MTSNDTKIDNASDKPVGSVYLTGAAVQEGQVDLAKTITYLHGLEKALKYYVAKTNPQYEGRSYSIEVRLRPGSLVTDIIAVVASTGVIGVAAVAGGSYLKAAAEQLAKNDIGERTSKEAAKTALSAMVTSMKIAKHRGSMMIGRTFKPEETKVIDAENIILMSPSGKPMKVTKAELDRYRETPRNEFRDMMSLVDRETSMYVGDEPIDKDHIPESAVSVDFHNRHVFDDRDEVVDETLLFPELTQGLRVELEGELTRGNGRTNTLGFAYDGRILKCIPQGADIKDMRNMLFGNVRIDAVVERRSTAKNSTAVLKKPVLRILSVESIDDEADSEQSSLLNL